MCDSPKHPMIQTTMNPTITKTQTLPLFHNPYGKSPKNIPQAQAKSKHTTTYHQQSIISPAKPLPPGTTTLPTTKGNNYRICYINVNGLITVDSDRLCEITKYMLEHNIDIFGISETNLNTSNINTYQKICKNIRTHLNDKKATITTSNTTSKHKQLYQPGGTAIITKQIISAQTTMREYDKPYGRWSTIIIGPPNHQIAIITAYIVCPTPITPLKHKTAAYQQWQIMSTNNVLGHPRKKAIKDLIDYITKKNYFMF